MAEVYPWCNDKAAHTADARRGMQPIVAGLSSIAAAALAGPHSEGHSRIDVEQGHLDYYIYLNDERGDKAAAAIEYGRKRSRKRGNTTVGKGALRAILGAS